MNLHPGPRVMLGVSLLAITGVLLVAPVIPTSQKLTIQGNYQPGADRCLSGSINSSSIACLQRYAYPPVELQGLTSLSYSL
ncbi:MAG TPA: hypothetical protein VFE91_02215, partial [Nitrososphaerales archaeon]|nr:hypothetical protein [Nitrososphaerales archaeon]